MKSHLRIVSGEPPDRGMRADVALDHRYRARRTGLTAVEYASAVQRFKRPTTMATKLGYLIAAALVLGATYLGAA